MSHASDRQGPTELSERNRRLIDHILGDGAHKGFADLATILETFMEAARADAANPPQEERSDPLDLAAADDNHKTLVEELEDLISAVRPFAADCGLAGLDGVSRERAVERAKVALAAFQSRQEEK